LHLPCANGASTDWRHSTLSAELTRVRNLPAQRNFPSVARGVTGGGPYAAALATPTGQVFPGWFGANRTQLIIGGRFDVSPAIALHDAQLTAETSMQWLTNLPGLDALTHRPQRQPRHRRVQRLVPGRLERLRSNTLPD
jgi:hypothetical protein